MTLVNDPLPPPPEELRFRRRIRLGSALREVWQARELVRTLAERDLRARYKQAMLGFAWAVFTPVVLMLVFTVFFKRVAKVDTGDIPYPLFSYVGLLPWSFFSTAVSQGSQSLTNNSALLNKVYCPREVFPLSSVLVASVDTTISLCVLAFLFAVYTYAPAPTFYWIPVLFAIQLAFTLGVCLVTSSVLVYFRDLRQAMPILLQLGLFATPVAYGIDAIPGSFRWVYCLVNPLAAVIDGYRRTVLEGQAPDLALLGLASVTAFSLLIGGYALFKRLETGFADVA